MRAIADLTGREAIDRRYRPVREQNQQTWEIQSMRIRKEIKSDYSRVTALRSSGVPLQFSAARLDTILTVRSDAVLRQYAIMSDQPRLIECTPFNRPGRQCD